MLSFLYGIAGSVLVAVLFAGGFFTGWKLKGKTVEAQHHEAEIAYTEKQLKSMRDMDEAFNKMLEYSADTAYGMDRGLEED